MMRAEFLRRAERRRFRLSLLGALGFYVLAALIVFVSGLAKGRDIADMPSPVWIDLDASAGAGQAGAKLEAASKVATPNPSPTVSPQPKVEAPPPKVAAKTNPPPSPAPAKAAKAAPAQAIPATPSGDAAAKAATTAVAGAAAGDTSTPVETWVPGPRPAGSRVIGSESGQLASTESSAALTTVVSGNEKGNSLETVLGARAGKAGRSLYVPIYLYMPLPKTIDASVAGRVPAPRRELFFKYYARAGDSWTLSRDAPVGDRDEIWLALEEGGYDFASADYLAGGRLQPVTISFVVTQVTAKSPPRIEAVTVTASSGDPRVDEAVVYGFKRASFFNATDGTIAGTFTYRFSK